jgi:hypothetical protein
MYIHLYHSKGIGEISVFRANTGFYLKKSSFSNFIISFLSPEKYIKKNNLSEFSKNILVDIFRIISPKFLLCAFVNYIYSVKLYDLSFRNTQFDKNLNHV